MGARSHKHARGEMVDPGLRMSLGPDMNAADFSDKYSPRHNLARALFFTS